MTRTLPLTATLLLVTASALAGQAPRRLASPGPDAAGPADRCDPESPGPDLGGVVADLLTEAARPGAVVALEGEGPGGRDILSVTDDAGTFYFCDLPRQGPSRWRWSIPTARRASGAR